MQAKSHHEKEQHRIERRLAEIAQETAGNTENLATLQARIETHEHTLITERENFETMSERYEDLKANFEAKRTH